jgi:pimeloyl-ACP methyl ester carboxylesterase
MASIDVTGSPIEYVRRGAGEPLLLIQGMSGTHAGWGEPFLGLLEPHFDLIAYDHRGIGASAPREGSFTIANLADDAAGVLDALGIEQAHVLGISMGGMVAQELAIAHPERIRTLALGCTYPGGAGSKLTDQAVVQRLLAGFATGDPEQILRASFEVNVSPAFAAGAGEWERFLAMAREVPAPIPVVFEQLRAAGLHNAGDRLHSISAPTLVIHGDRDEMLDVLNGELIARLIPGARLEILPGVGHLFWWEQPEVSARLLAEHAGAAAPAS